jgi:hypothetical protein
METRIEIIFRSGDKESLEIEDVLEICVHSLDETFKISPEWFNDSLIIRSMNFPLIIRPKAENYVSIESQVPFDSDE